MKTRTPRHHPNRPMNARAPLAKRMIALTAPAIALILFIFTFSIYASGYRADPVPQEKVGAPANPRLDEVRAQLAAIKDGMMMDGRYACCTGPSCDLCAMAENGCECGNSLAKGGPVCPECKGGWMAGFGTMPDIDAKDVKVLPDDQVKKMYQNRAALVKKSRKSLKKN